MMPITKEVLDRTVAERHARPGELATYARLEWRGQMHWLSGFTRERPRGHLRFGWLRRRAPAPTPDSPPQTPKAPVVLHRVRIEPDLEILISLRGPDAAAGAGFGRGARESEGSLVARLGVDERG